MNRDKEVNKYVEESFKRLLADEDKMKYLAYTTQIMPSIIKLLNEQRKELIEEFEKMIDFIIFNDKTGDKTNHKCLASDFWVCSDELKQELNKLKEKKNG